MQHDASPSSQRIRLVRGPARGFAGREVCLLVAFAPDGRVLPCTVDHMNALAGAGIDVILCLAVTDPGAAFDDAGLDAAAGIVLRRNLGFDFGAWAAMVNGTPGLWDARRIYFTNDSILGPLDGFEAMIDRVRRSQAEFVALTDSWQFLHHTQSYFFVLQGEGLRSGAIRAFWRQVKSHADKRDVIRHCELPFYAFVTRQAGLKAEILFPYEKIAARAKGMEARKLNPTHHLWEDLIEAGFPYIKAELLRDNPFGADLGAWRAIAAAHGGDVERIEAHLEMSRAMRGA